MAADTRGKSFAFDAEDFHSAESDDAVSNPLERTLIQAIESECLPRCRHITASSPNIARAYQAKYGVPTPVSILNVFPLIDVPARPSSPSSAGPVRLYWFSQTIGPSRGLEQAVPILSKMRTPTELHLRGLESPGFREELTRKAADAGYLGRIEYLPLAPPEEMARLSQPFDLGLSVELTTPENRNLCLTNKIFAYLLAGVPVILSRTEAQTEIADALGDAAVLIDLEDPDDSARILDNWLAEKSNRERACSHAWQLARERFNWDVEQQKLVNVFAKSLNSDPGISEPLFANET
jgi:glycosyltransferase involved in cell wall biosynthesis